MQFEQIYAGAPFLICRKMNDAPIKGFLVRTAEDLSQFPPEAAKSILVVEKASDIPSWIKCNLRFTADGNAERMDMENGKWTEVFLPQILTQAVENNGMFMSCDSPMLIRYEKTGKLPTGIGTWPKTNWETTAYPDAQGRWHNKPQILQAAFIRREIPDFARGGNIIFENGELKVFTSWGSISTCREGEGYLIRYTDDNENGTPCLNILTASEDSVDSYVVCEPSGKPVCSLRELDSLIRKL